MDTRDDSPTPADAPRLVVFRDGPWGGVGTGTVPPPGQARVIVDTDGLIEGWYDRTDRVVEVHGSTAEVWQFRDGSSSTPIDHLS